MENFTVPRYLRSESERLCSRPGKCPEQIDDWSCGHRVVLHFQRLMEKGLGVGDPTSWLQNIDDLTLSATAVTDEKMARLCNEHVKPEIKPGVKPFQQSTPKAPTKVEASSAARPVHMKRETSLPTPCRSRSSTSEQPSANGVQGTMSLRSKIDETLLSTKRQNNGLPTTSQAKEAAIHSVSKTEKTTEPKSKDEPDSSEQEGELTQDLAELVKQCWEERLSKREQKQMADFAKRVLNHCQLDFNKHFQKAHSQRLEKGHWTTFLEAVAAGGHGKGTGTGISSLRCDKCKRLIEVFNIPDARDQILLAKAEAKARAHSGSGDKATESSSAKRPAEDAGVIVPFQPAESLLSGEPLPKKSRAGRPRKDEVRSFNLLEFLESERYGQYKILDAAEAGGFTQDAQ